MTATPIRLHPNALRILVLIQGRRDRGLSPPSVRELGKAVGIYPKAIVWHLHKLRRLGLVTWDVWPDGGVLRRTLRANYRFEVAD